jgi:hypothetical protein
LLALGVVLMWPSPPARPAGPKPIVTILPPTAPEPPGNVAPAPDAVAAPPAPPAPPADAVPDDTQIAAETTRRFAASEALKDVQLGVAVEAGIVTLTGRARNTQREVAAALAGTVTGVKEVRNKVEDLDAPPPLDPRVQELVQDGYAALARGDHDAAITKFNAALEIDASCGVARLGIDRARAGR